MYPVKKVYLDIVRSRLLGYIPEGTRIPAAVDRFYTSNAGSTTPRDIKTLVKFHSSQNLLDSLAQFILAYVFEEFVINDVKVGYSREQLLEKFPALEEFVEIEDSSTVGQCYLSKLIE